MSEQSTDTPHYSGLPFAEPPERFVHTHCSLILLRGDTVYKLKKAVKFPFLDYSTPALRKEFCFAEVSLNRRFSPEIYLGACGVFARDGKLVFGPVFTDEAAFDNAARQEPIDYAVVMKRIPDDAWLPAVVGRDALPDGAMDALVERLLRAYDAEPTSEEVRNSGLPENLRGNTVANVEEIKPFIGRSLTRQRWDRLAALLKDWFEANPEVFRRRVEENRIRDGHGDLKPTNVAFADGKPLITDCIEFKPLFRRLDMLCEVGFLATGLESLGYFAQAAQVFRSYRKLSGDDYPEILRRYYQAHLACVMGKVTSFQLDDPNIPAEIKEHATRLAGHYFALGDFHAGEPYVVMVGGVMGCGKSTRAEALGEALGWPVVSSDIERKRLAGCRPTDRLPKNAYSAEMTEKTYGVLVDAAEKVQSGVVLDAQFGSRRQRERMVEAAKRAGASVFFVWCDASEELVRRRMLEREQNPERISDARADMLSEARARFETPEESEGFFVVRHDTAKPAGEAVNSAMAALLGSDFNPRLATR